MDLLMLLVGCHGQLVTRAAIVERLWNKDVVVEFETGVNTAIRKVRQALGDSREEPRFIETVPSKGYRFIASVEVTDNSHEIRFPVRLAVLPFENLGAESESEYLTDGLTEETIAALGQIDPEHLQVIGRTSTMTYKHTKLPVEAIGKELGVDFLVEGSTQRERGRLRIIAKLTRVCDQTQVWSASYDREPAGVLGVQQELSTSIARQIRLRLSPERVVALSRRHTTNAEAYDLYLRGRRFWHQLTPSTTRAAVEYFTRATELDPEYALAWAGIAEAHASGPINGDAPPADAWVRAAEAAARAIRTDPDLAEAQHVLGQVSWMFEWDWLAAEVAFRRAVDLDRSFAFSFLMLGHVLSQAGRHDEARVVMSRALELEPLSALHYAISSQVAFQARDYVSSLEHAGRAIAIDPEFWVGFMMRGQAHEQLGQPDLAIEALAMAGRMSGGNSKPIALRGYVLARQGRTQEAREVIDMLETVTRRQYVPPYALALLYAGLNMPETMFFHLDRSYEARDVHLVFLTVDPKWDPHRADPRFQALLERCKFTRHSPPR